MNVVYIVSTLERSGPINILYNILKKFNYKEISVSIITLSPEGKDTRVNDFKYLGCKIVPLNLSRFKGVFYSGGRIKRIIDEINPQIVHSHGFRPDILSWLYLKNVKRVSTLHNYPFEDYVMEYGNFIGTVMSLFSVIAYKKMDLCIPCSHSIKEKFSSKLSSNTLVIQNGVDFNIEVDDFDHIKKAKESLGISEGKPVFIYLGKLIKRKDPGTVLSAFSKAFKEDEAELLIVGSGELEIELKRTFEKNTNIKFIGHVNNPNHYLLASDYYISASFSEGFPTAVLEAMSLGIPVLLSNIPSHKEMLSVSKNNAGLFFGLGNVSDLVIKMKSIRSMNYEEVSNSARNIVGCHFSSQIMAEKYLKAYYSLNK